VIYEVIAAFLLTLLFGPIAFYAIGKYTTTNLPLFPLHVVDGVGDTIFLPLFNAVSVYQGLVSVALFVAIPYIILSLFLTLLLTAYIVYFQRRNEWSRPRRGSVNIGTVYHSFFTWIQITIILLALRTKPSLLLILLLASYLCTAVYSMVKSGYN